MNGSASISDHDLLVRIDERVTAIRDHLRQVDEQAIRNAAWIELHEKDHGRTMKVLSGISLALGALAGSVASLIRH